MTEIVDFFFSPYPTLQSRRLRAAVEDGLAHGSRIEPQDPLPGRAVTLLFNTNAQKPIDHVAVYYTTDGSMPEGSRGVAVNGSVVLAELAPTLIEDQEHGLTIRSWYATIPALAEGTLVYYRADAWSSLDAELQWFADRVDPITKPQPHGRIFTYHVDTWATPSWWQDAIVYQVFVDRFNAGKDEPALANHDERAITDFFGGTLQGVIEKLDYIQDLGCNCVWLSPVFESPTPHGYNPSSYHKVSQRYGGDEKLLELVAEVHKRGMRIILDFVANHTSDEHPAFVEAQQNPTSSKAAWYDFEYFPGYYRSYAMVDAMPELSTDYPEVREYLYGAARYWLEHFGADGLRLDYVPGPSLGFWAGYQVAVKQAFPDAVTIGEITSPMPEIAEYAGRMDGFMDFPLAKLTRSTFGSRCNTLVELLSYLDARCAAMPLGMSTGTLLDNHDTHRFLWMADGKIERLRLAAAFHMTLEGTPIIYYGTEVGLSQYADAHQENAYCRAPMFWDERQDLDLLRYYRQLTALRHAHEVLRTGQRTRVTIEAQDAALSQDVGAYLRHNGTEYILVVLNNNEQSVRVRLDLQSALEQAGIHATDSSVLHNLLEHGQQMPYQGQLELALPALGSLIFAGEKKALLKKVY